MHIITGLALAALAGRLKHKQGLGGLPKFQTGPLRVAHAVPGRIRFEVPALQGAGQDALAWVKDMSGLEGVDNVQVNTVTGSVVVRYREGAVEPPMLFGALARLLGLEADLEKTPAPMLVRELRELGKSANFAVYDKSGGVVDLWSLTLAALAVVGARKVLESGWTSFPSGFTLIWWAFNGISRGQADGR